MTRIGANMAGGNPKRGRRKNDWYPTPPGTTRALIPVLKESNWPKSIWECACGDGRMSQELSVAGFSVVSTDIAPRMYGKKLDLLTTTKPLGRSVVTNPPFKFADEFIVHLLGILGIEYVALILPMQFWNAKSRVAIFNQWRPALVLPMTWRIDNTGEGRPTMSNMWCVWAPNLKPVRGFDPLTTDERNPGNC